MLNPTIPLRVHFNLMRLSFQSLNVILSCTYCAEQFHWTSQSSDDAVLSNSKGLVREQTILSWTNSKDNQRTDNTTLRNPKSLVRGQMIQRWAIPGDLSEDRRYALSNPKGLVKGQTICSEQSQGISQRTVHQQNVEVTNAEWTKRRTTKLLIFRQGPV